jgi:hypothetical protein
LFFIYWLFCCVHFQTINFDSPRGGISLVTEKGVLTTSRLLVQKAIPSDSGKHDLFFGGNEKLSGELLEILKVKNVNLNNIEVTETFKKLEVDAQENRIN